MQSRLFVFAGPSGIGKSFIMHQLQQRYPDRFIMPKLLTTRLPRPSEAAADRDFITPAKFESMVQHNEFAWHDSFYNNQYGYTHEMLKPLRQHILINALPTMVELFATFQDAVMVGLSINPSNLELLKRRLEARGDPPSALSQRVEALQTDIKIMNDQQPLIEKHGKFFEIQDDSTAEEVINWLEYNYL